MWNFTHVADAQAWGVLLWLQIGHAGPSAW